jgi:hypothetical protein
MILKKNITLPEHIYKKGLKVEFYKEHAFRKDYFWGLIYTPPEVAPALVMLRYRDILKHG